MNLDQSLCFGCFQAPLVQGVCPECGFLHDPLAFPTALSPGTVLGRYMIGRVLGKPGGFGITYLAFDPVLERRVAIKELMPRELVARKPDGESLYVQTRDDIGLFDYTRRSFLNEARLLAQLSHPNLVRVLDFFDANATAYFAMEYYEGRTLQEHVAASGGRLPADEAVAIMLPILDALEEIHSRDQPILHRDIKPANIYLAKRTPILLDFGAARMTLGEQSRSLSAVLTPGFAPYEQYSSRGNQGPWTDVYGCAATLYFLVTGRPPPDASARIEDPRVEDPRVAAPDLPGHVASAIVTGLGFRTGERPQTAREFSALLVGKSGRVNGESVLMLPVVSGDPDLTPPLTATEVAGSGYSPIERFPGPNANVGNDAMIPANAVGATPAEPSVPGPVRSGGRRKGVLGAVALGILVLAVSAALVVGREPGSSTAREVDAISALLPVDESSPTALPEGAAAVDSMGAIVSGSAVRSGEDPQRTEPQTSAEVGRVSAAAPNVGTSQVSEASPSEVAGSATIPTQMPAVRGATSAETLPVSAGPAESAMGIAVVIYADERNEAEQAETAVLGALSGRAGYQPLNATSLAMIRGEQTAVNRAISQGDFTALAALGQEHGAEFLLVGDLAARAAPSFGQFYSGTAELDIKMYRISTGTLVDARVFRVGAAGSQPTSALSEQQARSQAAEQAGRQAANSVRQWMDRELR